jgi:hypothetical protein
MNKVDISVNQLVGMVERGELRLPEMQRRYVWRATRVRDLLDSLYRGYPSGSILVWETEQEQPTRDLPVAQHLNPFAGHKLLLDGQQRLTSLSAILRGEPVLVRGRRREIDILFNLDHPDALSDFTEIVADEDWRVLEDDAADEVEEQEEEISLQERFRNMTFVVASKALAQQKNWVSVTKAFKSDNDSQILKAAGVESFDDLNFEKYSARLRKLRSMRDYLYVMHVLPRSLSYQEVAEIFVRVNSLGVKLRGSDLALAQITARWRNSLELIEKFQDECEERWMTLDLGVLVRAMVVFATGQSRFDRVSAIPIDKLKQGWEDAKEGLRFAINFLRTNADIEDESLVSSPLFFITIAYFSHLARQKITRDEERSLLYWLYVANARGRYSRGASESMLDADLSILKKDGGPDGLIEVVRQQFGRLNFEPTDFLGRGAGSSLFSLVFLALKAKKATDWRTGLGLSLTHQGKYHYIQYHHIFPKALLKGKFEKQEINEISNMAFVSGRMNREIRASEPCKYFPGIIKSRGEEALTLQAIPLDSSLHAVENYRTFLETRRKMLAEELNAFLEKAKVG